MRQLTTCDRCHKDTRLTIMSFFNTDTICMDCKQEEKQHPHYEQARKTEHNHVCNGNYNFKGIYSHMSWDEIKSLG